MKISLPSSWSKGKPSKKYEKQAASFTVGDMFLRNVGHSPRYKELQTRRPWAEILSTI
jgi:hypothetical protein